MGADRGPGRSRRPSKSLGQGIEALVRDGGGAGLRLVVTGGRELLSGRITSAHQHQLALRLPDGDAALAGIRPGAARAAGPGRGVLALPGGHAAQVGIVDDLWPPKGWPRRRGGHTAPTLVRPADVGRAGEPGRHEGLKRPDDDGCPEDGAGLVLGVGGPLAEPLAWSPADDSRRFLVAGRASRARHGRHAGSRRRWPGWATRTVLVAAGASRRAVPAPDSRSRDAALPWSAHPRSRRGGRRRRAGSRAWTSRVCCARNHRRVDRSHRVVVSDELDRVGERPAARARRRRRPRRCGVLLQPADARRRRAEGAGPAAGPRPGGLPGTGWAGGGIQLVQADA